ncbi:MAG: hypothetical protein Q8M66_03865, partial [Actinomycetota bacterium]|nr:hypothetical protein [Actinomycetota bacterium]
MTEIVFNARKINELYVSNDYEELSEYFLNVLASLQKQAWNEQNAERSRFVNLFLKSFLYFFTQEDYQLSDEAGTRFIRFNTLIGNLAGMSVFETTDSHLELLRKQSANFVKILTLLNARSQAKFETAQFFKAQPKFATLWYTEYFGQFYGGTPTKTMYDNARRHVSSLGLRWEYADPNMSNFYFFPSYFAIEQEARLKNLYHRLVKPIMARAKIKNSPNQKSIAIVSASWVRTSAVYKSLAPYVEALRHDYDLTLVRLGSAPNRDDFDDTWFKQVKNVAIVGDQFQLNEILENDFALAYFPDIG